MNGMASDFGDSAACFEFHSDFWLNLHHSLYGQALCRRGMLGIEDLVGLADENRPEWRAAVAYYEKNLVSTDVLYCNGLVKTRNILERCDSSCIVEEDCGLSRSLVTALNAAAGVYREVCWKRQHSMNVEWIAHVAGFVSTTDGKAVQYELAEALRAPWPHYPIRVDVSCYATWAGAYTTKRPPRITIASTDATNQNHTALEVLYHEACHLMTDTLEAALLQESIKQAASLPEADLWHAVLFYTTGEIMRRHFEGYVPYATRYGIWSHAWPMYLEPLHEAWLPYIRGSVTFEDAVAALIDEASRAVK